MTTASAHGRRPSPVAHAERQRDIGGIGCSFCVTAGRISSWGIDMRGCFQSHVSSIGVTKISHGETEMLSFLKWLLPMFTARVTQHSMPATARVPANHLPLSYSLSSTPATSCQISPSANISRSHDCQWMGGENLDRMDGSAEKRTVPAAARCAATRNGH